MQTKSTIDFFDNYDACELVSICKQQDKNITLLHFLVLVGALNLNVTIHIYISLSLRSKSWSVQLHWVLQGLIWPKLDKLAGMHSVHVVQRRNIKGYLFLLFFKRENFETTN